MNRLTRTGSVLWWFSFRLCQYQTHGLAVLIEWHHPPGYRPLFLIRRRNLAQRTIRSLHIVPGEYQTCMIRELDAVFDTQDRDLCYKFPDLRRALPHAVFSPPGDAPRYIPMILHDTAGQETRVHFYLYRTESGCLRMIYAGPLHYDPCRRTRNFLSNES